jgi:hypothetical protein
MLQVGGRQGIDILLLTHRFYKVHASFCCYVLRDFVLCTNYATRSALHFLVKPPSLTKHKTCALCNTATAIAEATAAGNGDAVAAGLAIATSTGDSAAIAQV